MIRKILPLFLFTLGLSAATLQPVDEAGYTKLVASQKGKVALVNFWATYCVPCRAEMPKLVDMAARLGPKGFQLITISADEPEQEAAAVKFLEKVKVPAPVYIKKAKNDDKFITSIEAKWSGALPATFLYNKQGKKVKTFIGEVDFKVLEAEVAKLLQ